MSFQEKERLFLKKRSAAQYYLLVGTLIASLWTFWTLQQIFLFNFWNRRKCVFFFESWKESFHKFETIQICCGFSIFSKIYFRKIDFPQFTSFKMSWNKFFIYFYFLPFFTAFFLFLAIAFCWKTFCSSSFLFSIFSSNLIQSRIIFFEIQKKKNLNKDFLKKTNLWEIERHFA